MSGYMQDVRYALRQMLRAPGFTFTAIITLALGIGANTAIFTVFNQVLLRHLPVEAPQQLEQVTFVGSDMGHMSSFGGDGTLYFSNAMYHDLRDKNTVFSGVFANVEDSVGVSWKNQAETADAEMVSGNYFQVLGVPAFAGRTFIDDDDKVKDGSPVAVLSYAYWQERFASDRGVVGQTLLVNGHPFQIVGVAAPGFSSAIGGFKPKLFVPITMESQVKPGRDYLLNRRARFLNVVGRLKPGVSPATAQASLTVLWKALRAEELKAIPHASQRFSDRFVNQSSIILVDDARGFSPTRTELKTPLMILMGMVLLLAAMTCINLMSLLLVRGAARGKEFAVRYALGAARGRIIRQMIVEGVLLGLIGGALGLAFAPAAAEFLVRRVTSATGEAAFSTRPDAWVLAFNLVLSLGISVLFSLAPAWQMMKPNLTDGLRQKAASGLGAAQRIRTIAIGLQIGLSVLLLSGAGLFVRTLYQLKGQNLGMSTDHVVLFALDPTMSGYANSDSLAVHERVQAALASLPGVKALGGSTDPVLSGSESIANISVEGYTPPPEDDTDMETPLITPGYFDALGIKLLAGRTFNEADRAGAAKVAVVSQGFAAKFFGSPEKALGHLLKLGGGAGPLDTQIIGIVADTKHYGVRDEIKPVMYLPFAQGARPRNGLAWYVRTTQAPESAENMIRAAIHTVDPKLVPDGIKTMTQQIDDNVSNERMIALLAACFAIVALLTTAVGLYGVLAYATAQRTREIGIRMALGAQRWSVVRLILTDMARVAGISIVLALPVSIALSRLMRSQLFEVSPFDPLTLTACVVVTASMVLVASAVPARRAASVEPTQALRTE
ncbi:ABC transporter permease [Granulicella sibirica]|uniref:ABC-type transporter n=1 Tax=Granulicella sibirica TaxID=2479048 RepID=A0A4Q0T4G3_9BACT|nr:ABC transporter permease [Granulicella sibirica]RXH56928.1 ABC-type transporter [Granulicella sibirica]